MAACAAGVRVGVIGAGIDLRHPSLAGSRLRVVHAETRRDRALLPQWQGTALLGLLASDAASPAPGLIPEADYLVADVLHLDRRGEPVADLAAVIEALQSMETSRVQVLLIALSGSDQPLLRDAISRLHAKGTLIIAPAGDGGPEAPPSYPAAYADVIAATAVDRHGKPYDYANRGGYITLAAPGVDLLAALPSDHRGFVSGTAFSAAYMTAVTAAAYRSISGAATKANLLALLLPTPLSARDPVVGYGLLRAPSSLGGCAAP